MNTPLPNLLVAAFDQAVCIKISGRANFTSSLDLKKLINELSDRGCNRFVFDLSDCLMMDSTFLGVLSGIGLKFADAPNGTAHSIELLNPNPRIAETLENLGVAHLFRILVGADPAAPKDFQPLPCGEQASRAEVTRTCLEAHQLLMSINPENVGKFKDVAAFLAEDLKRIEASENK